MWIRSTLHVMDTSLCAVRSVIRTMDTAVVVLHLRSSDFVWYCVVLDVGTVAAGNAKVASAVCALHLIAHLISSAVVSAQLSPLVGMRSDPETRQRSHATVQQHAGLVVEATVEYITDFHCLVDAVSHAQLPTPTTRLAATGG